jgi:hypothetical protein
MMTATTHKFRAWEEKEWERKKHGKKTLPQRMYIKFACTWSAVG